MSERKRVTIYTDGACTGNPGPGGWAAVLLYNGRRREVYGGFRLTTNNRMELMAALYALRELRYPCDVTLYTDSQYVRNGIALGWARKWRANGWRRGKEGPAVNPDLWGALLDECDRHDVVFEWVRGHAGDPENERCDELSVQAASGAELPPDIEYERSKPPQGDPR